jgi:predicted site-specific integrase-resolvase
MKLADWARKHGIAYCTAWRWFKRGKMPVRATKTPTGMILVEEESLQSLSENSEAHVYTRVSSPAKKADLERQAERVCEFCRARGWSVLSVIKEVASGMNDNRRKLTALLKRRPRRIVVEHKDRLTRFGFRYFELFMEQLGGEIVVVNRDKEERDDLLKDLVAIITSFCCRLYGLRRGRKKAEKVSETLK